MKIANSILSHKHKIVFVCFCLNKCVILAINQKEYTNFFQLLIVDSLTIHFSFFLDG